MNPQDFFSETEKKQLITAIQQAELNTSGEIRLHIESDCKTDVLDRAAYLFKKLEIHKTAQRNGVLFYLATNDRKFAILGDSGINQIVPEGFWNDIKEMLFEEFKQGNFSFGLEKGVLKAGDILKKHFPYQSNDVNELPDDISYGNNEKE